MTLDPPAVGVGLGASAPSFSKMEVISSFFPGDKIWATPDPTDFTGENI